MACSCTSRYETSLFPFLKYANILQDNAGVIVNPKGDMKGSVIVGPVAKECVGSISDAADWLSNVLSLRLTCGPVLQPRPAPLYDLDVVQSLFSSSSHIFH